MSAPVVWKEDRDQVAILTLNRPERRNALSRELVRELSDALSASASDSSVRAVVLTGAGPCFCTGMDLREASEASAMPESEQAAVADLKGIADLIQQIHAIPKPVVAAVNGDAFAGGAGLMAACDLVVAAARCRIAYPEVRRGLVAAIVMHDLIRQVGERRARWLLLTGEPISAEDAERWGLVNRVVAAENCREEAIALANELRDCGPAALATTKRLIHESAGAENSRGAAAVAAVVRTSTEAKEGIVSFLEKRSPRWTSGEEPFPG